MDYKQPKLKNAGNFQTDVLKAVQTIPVPRRNIQGALTEEFIHLVDNTLTDTSNAYIEIDNSTIEFVGEYFANRNVYFEVVGKTSAGVNPTLYNLYNKTTSAIVPGSALTISATSTTLTRSLPIQLNKDRNKYVVRYSSQGGATATIYAARLVIN